jgi:hypothetical protein
MEIMGTLKTKYLDLSNPYFATDSFYFANVPTLKGNYKIVDHNQSPACSDIPKITEIGTFYGINEEDTGRQQYKVLNLTKENNYLQIDEYNKDTKEIKGRFQVTFVLKYLPKSRSSDPDTIRFTNGVFHTKVFD